MSFEPRDARVEIGLGVLVLLLQQIDLVLEFFVLSLQRLHLRLQIVDPVDQIDAALRVVLLLLETIDALGEAHALGMRRPRRNDAEKSDGGHEGRRADVTDGTRVMNSNASSHYCLDV